jgi:hypothetical protein
VPAGTFGPVKNRVKVRVPLRRRNYESLLAVNNENKTANRGRKAIATKLLPRGLAAANS